MDYPCKAGGGIIPEKRLDQLQSVSHEYLIATSEEGISYTNALDGSFVASTNILGFIDLDTNEHKREYKHMMWVMSEEEKADNVCNDYFENLKIYHVKCRPFKSGGLYLEEIISDKINNSFLEGVIQKYLDSLHLYSELFGEMDIMEEYPAYRGKFNWLGSETEIIVAAEFTPVTEPLGHMERLCRECELHDRTFREYATDNLLEEVNKVMQKKYSGEDLASGLKMKSITMYYGGNYEVYYAFNGCVVNINGDLSDPGKSYTTYIEQYNSDYYDWSL